METLNCKNEIINRALSLLREKEIIDGSMEPESDTEKLIYKWYETAKAECIIEIEPNFAIKRLKLNREKIVNTDDLSEFTENKSNKNIEFKDWLISVVENDINQYQSEINKLETLKEGLTENLGDELIKPEPDEKQIKNLEKRIKKIKINIHYLKEKIRFLKWSYELSTELEPAEEEETVEEETLVKEETPVEEEETVESIPIIPLKPAYNPLLKSILRRKRVMFFKELKRQEQIRKYEEYKSWEDYKNKLRQGSGAVYYAYRIPSDCLKIFDKNFELLEGNYIYSYQDNGLTIKYLSNNTELYPREIKFNIALSYVLAYYICADLQNNDNKTQLFFKLKNNKISEARTSKLRETGVEIIKNYRWKK